MRNRYLVTYDITEDERRTSVYKTLRGFGDHLQYSVFRCDLSSTDRARLLAALHPLIDQREDQILIVDLGPVDGRASACVESIGRPYRPPERTVIVI
ncbi:MAG TPA: CRISPR-associated endonuclease Cas2 [Kofleriaceae bacterium]|nr:CRISPR-associated endonuclease Cas2 [Kofleriaceae bacterium]